MFEDMLSHLILGVNATVHLQWALPPFFLIQERSRILYKMGRTSWRQLQYF